MKKLILTTAALLVFAVVTEAASWNLDAAHSSVGFSVRHLVVSKTKGIFGKFEGTAEFDSKDLASGKVSLSVDMASIDTDNEKRDDHLKSADFFDAETFPKMTFVSTKIHDVDGESFQLTGNLTIKDVTKEVTFDCEFNGEIADPWGNTRTGFSAETSIDRQAFNITWSKSLEAGGLVVGNDVKVSLEIEWVQAKETAEK